MPEVIIKAEKAVIRQQKVTILKEVSLEIKAGEFVYLIGKVGSGKSSFLKTLYAELPLEYGQLEVAGFHLKKLKKSQVPMLRRKCGIVFQDFRLLTDRNVNSNLEFVLKATGWKNKKAIRERIESVLEKVEMTEKRWKMPHELSGGEQQRIVLARALLNAPPIILADEPTGNIDPETSYRLVELLKGLCETGKTVLIATHQYDLLEHYPGRVFRCDAGVLTEDPVLSVHPEFAEESCPVALDESVECPEETAEAREMEEPVSAVGDKPETAGEEASETVAAETEPDQETEQLLRDANLEVAPPEDAEETPAKEPALTDTVIEAIESEETGTIGTESEQKEAFGFELLD
ncbi:MAG: ATP-binding cassette domain-containing protein [Culturomica sp.]|jgi:cell division transport system ATP-binding protein|nr:ATP-binding cassette domain-containing protein [Culturomica sp.]